MSRLQMLVELLIIGFALYLVKQVHDTQGLTAEVVIATLISLILVRDFFRALISDLEFTIERPDKVEKNEGPEGAAPA